MTPGPQPATTEPRRPRQAAATGRSDDSRAPLLSVLVPCWNAEASIERALASVLDERAVPLECVVVDDGSTDRTAAIVDALAARDQRLVLVRAPANEGVSSARNRGLRVVRGEWLTLLDADDRFRPGGLATLVRAARESDALAVVGQQVWTDSDRQWISRFYDIPDIREPGRKSMVRNPGLLYYASPHGKLFHRSVTEGLRFSGRVLGDQPWTIRALLRSEDRIEVIDEVVYEWSRPARSGVAQSITTTFRSSARLGVEAARIAVQAFDSVRSEADRVVVDRGAREVVLARYVERLLRSDLGVHLSEALRRGDPTTGELLTAIERFVAHVPAGLLAASDAPARDILELPLARWYRMSPSARRAYWSLFAAVLSADPNVSRRASSAPARLGLRLASGGDVARRAAAIALLVPAHAATVASRVVRSRLGHRW